MSTTQKQAARKFVEYWTFQRGSEKGEDQQFWNSLLRDVLGIMDVEQHIKYQVPVQLKNTTKFLDAWIPETRVLIEHKSRGVNLDAPQAGHGGITPYEQAVEYDNARPFDEKARWIVTCNFDEFRIYDRSKPLAPPLTLKLGNLPKEAYRLAFLVNPKEKAIDRELEISVQAGRIVGKIYDALLKQYGDGNADHLAALNRLCVRLVFCLYAEDADIFPKDCFRRLMENTPAPFLRKRLIDLFQTLDTPPDKRNPYLEPELCAFPYTNGGLFRLAAAETAAPHMESRHLGGVPKLKFGVVSDVHVRLAADGRSLAAGYETDTLEKTFAYFRDQGVDAVMIAGDMADLGLTRELKAVADAWFKVFPNDRAPDGRKVERLFVFGNHDAFGLRNGGRVFKDATVLAREAIQADPKKAWAECFNEEWQPYYTRNVKGFDFFCSHWQPGIWCNGVAETGCAGCVDAFRGLMEKCDPSRPFFYVQHPHPRDTVYGKCAWGMDDGSATKLLSDFPQAIAFSGHSHEPLTNEKSIWRGAFTSVGTGSLRYLAADALRNFEYTAGYENGRCNVYLPGGVRREDRQAFYAAYDAPKMMAVETNRPDIRVGQIVSVYDDRVEFAKREFVSGLQLGEDWVVELPAKPRAFQSFARVAKPAEFPAGSASAGRLRNTRSAPPTPAGACARCASARSTDSTPDATRISRKPSRRRFRRMRCPRTSRPSA